MHLNKQERVFTNWIYFCQGDLSHFWPKVDKFNEYASPSSADLAMDFDNVRLICRTGEHVFDGNQIDTEKCISKLFLNYSKV